MSGVAIVGLWCCGTNPQLGQPSRRERRGGSYHLSGDATAKDTVDHLPGEQYEPDIRADQQRLGNIVRINFRVSDIEQFPAILLQKRHGTPPFLSFEGPVWQVADTPSYDSTGYPQAPRIPTRGHHSSPWERVNGNNLGASPNAPHKNFLCSKNKTSDAGEHGDSNGMGGHQYQPVSFTAPISSAIAAPIATQIITSRDFRSKFIAQTH